MADTSVPPSALGVPNRRKVVLPPPPSAAELLCANAPEKKLYWDRSHYDSPESQMRALASSSTLYIGNLAFSTRTCHLRALFSTLGPVAMVRLGLDRFRKTPCGFAFVEYANRLDALQAVACLTGTKLDGRVIRVELDAGFKPGRQYGRGVSGGQVRDDRRTSVDPARAGGGRTPRNSGGGGGPPKWQSPESLRQQQQQQSGGGGHYGPAQSASSGEKRRREEDGEDQLPSSKNPRFGDEGSEDGMD